MKSMAQATDDCRHCRWTAHVALLWLAALPVVLGLGWFPGGAVVGAAEDDFRSAASAARPGDASLSPTIASLVTDAQAAGRRGDWPAALAVLLQAERLLPSSAMSSSAAATDRETEISLRRAIATAAWHLQQYDLVVQQCQRLQQLLAAAGDDSEAGGSEAARQRLEAVQQLLARAQRLAGATDRSPDVTPPLPFSAADRDRWLADLQRLDRTATLPSPVVAELFQAALASGDDPLWQATLEALLVTDRDGRVTSQVLQRWASAAAAEPAGGDSAAALSEHLLIDLLSQLIDLAGSDAAGNSNHSSDPQAVARAAEALADGSLPAACAAAVRICGVQARWPLLAMLADDLLPPDVDRDVTLRRGLAIDRLIAESLMQTRRGSEALVWWTAIGAVWQCHDFPTRLRAAEAAVAFGGQDDARRRLDQLQAMADLDPFQRSLVALLSAELDMRGQRWDDARVTLAQLAGRPDTAAPLRPRAQWLIGETYLMQQQYGEAIDAYRRVDAIDQDGHWAAAALLQMGQAHEKLGQARQAAACYTGLLSRFADLPHASRARTRLAQLDESSRLHR